MGRTSNDDRSDSLNPNSHRYNPGSADSDDYDDDCCGPSIKDELRRQLLAAALPVKEKEIDMDVFRPGAPIEGQHRVAALLLERLRKSDRASYDFVVGVLSRDRRKTA